MNRLVVNMLIFMYVTIVIMLTVYLFMINDFGYSSVGKYTFITNLGDSDLTIVKRTNVSVGDEVIFYNSYEANSKLLFSKVVEVEKTNSDEYTYYLENGKFLSSSYLIGNTRNMSSLPFLGAIVNFLTSRLGYIIIVLPALVIQVILFKKVNYVKKD